MFWIYFLLAFLWTLVLIDFTRGYRKIPSIDRITTGPHEELISVIVAAKDEQASIENTIHSLAEQEDVHIEIIVVNDRSTDQTEFIASNMAAIYSNVKTISIGELPEGWLGKNHALWQGVKEASGNYYLFTDADIHFSKSAIAKAFSYFQSEKADHLTAAPDLRANSTLLKGLISFFLFGFSYLKRPWTANEKGEKGGIGIGAFQLISRNCYEGIGGHEAIPFRPDDDLVLGKQVKKHGYKQRLVTALNSLSVVWYPSLRAAFQGFEKNAFAGLNYSVFFSLFAIIGVLISQILPFFFIFSPSLSVQMISAINILLLFYLYVLTLKNLTNYSKWFTIGLPLFALLFVVMLIRALLLTWARGGIEWRGSRYSLKELKRHFYSKEGEK